MTAVCQGDWRGNKQVHILQHPGTNLLLSKLRDRNSSQIIFMSYANRLLRLLLEEAFALEPVIESERVSPTGAVYTHKELQFGEAYCVVVILRSGVSMLNEVTAVMPQITVGMVLIQRNESHPEKLPVYYYSKLPRDIAQRRVLLVDPMLATGGSAKTAIEALIRQGVKVENIVFVNLIACPEGINAVLEKYPGLKIVTGVVDPGMNGQKYIVPGLGDFGDRYFGTVHE
jgi:uracil phosphoribosyltransferase